MRIVKTKVYSFRELDEEAQGRALHRFSNINIDWDWWEFIYEDFKTVTAYFGITVDLKRTYFKGLDGQESGSSYTASVDISTMWNALQNQSWKAYMPDTKFDFPATAIDRRVMKLTQDRVIDAWANVRPSRRETGIRVDFGTGYTYNECVNYNHIENVLSDLKELTTEVCEELNHFLFSSLVCEYESCMSRTAVTAGILRAGIRFLKNGESFRG
jgi:hypothetical protein